MNVRWYRAADGTQQVHLTDRVIEEIAESELDRSRLVPTEASAIVDVEAFIERYLGARLDLGADLDPQLLGVTEFRVGAPPAILINRDLSDASIEEDEFSGALGRWRATLAHEAMHVVLHRFLFEMNAEQETLFEPGTIGAMIGAHQIREAVVSCLKRDVSYSRRARDPREVQANKGMAALLMPRGLFGTLARRAMRDRAEHECIEYMARIFAVSRQAARIRLQTLGFLERDGTYVVGILSGR